MRRSCFTSLHACIAACACPSDAAESPSASANANGQARVVTVRPAQAAAAKQGFAFFQGICRENAEAKGLCLYKVVIPPGGAAEAHYHAGHETAVYLLEGNVETFYGDRLQHSVVNGPGDFVYIPAGLPHKPVNLSLTEPAVAIVARTDPNEQEGIVPVAEPADLAARIRRQ